MASALCAEQKAEFVIKAQIASRLFELMHYRSCCLVDVDGGDVCDGQAARGDAGSEVCRVACRMAYGVTSTALGDQLRVKLRGEWRSSRGSGAEEEEEERRGEAQE